MLSWTVSLLRLFVVDLILPLVSRQLRFRAIAVAIVLILVHIVVFYVVEVLSTQGVFIEFGMGTTFLGSLLLKCLYCENVNKVTCLGFAASSLPPTL
jgi:hypothetical protein